MTPLVAELRRMCQDAKTDLESTYREACQELQQQLDQHFQEQLSKQRASVQQLCHSLRHATEDTEKQVVAQLLQCTASLGVGGEFEEWKQVVEETRERVLEWDAEMEQWHGQVQQQEQHWLAQLQQQHRTLASLIRQDKKRQEEVNSWKRSLHQMLKQI